jgi:hypothetical protein
MREAQLTPAGDDGDAKAVPDVVQLPVLMEQDFGSMEGKKWYDRLTESKVSGKEHHRHENKDTAGFVDVESKDAMARRADTFLDAHLLPLLGDASEDADQIVAIVSHGIFLSTLWKRLLLRLPPKSVTLSPDLQATARPSLEHLGGWSNTGYLELHLTQAKLEAPNPTADAHVVPVAGPSSSPAVDDGLGKIEVPQAAFADDPAAQSHEASPPSAVAASPAPAPRVAHGWTSTILMINGKDHLNGLKRTGGGVGSSRHDASQKSIETFFKRRKVE